MDLQKDKALISQELRIHEIKKGPHSKVAFLTYQNSMHECLISKVFTNIDKESEKMKIHSNTKDLKFQN